MKLFSVEIESALIGSLLASKNTELYISSIPELRPEHFYFAEQQEIYRFLSTTDKAITISSVKLFCDQALPDSKKIIEKLLTNAESFCPFKDYAKTLIELWQKRELKAVFESVSYGDSFESINSFLGQKMSDILVEGSKKSQTLQDVVKEILNGNPAEMIKFGFPNFDQFFGGVEVGSLIVLGGRPSMGKTTMAVNLAYSASKINPVLFFTLEVKNKAIARKVISSLASINAKRLKTNELNAHEKESLGRLDLSSSKFYLEDEAELTLNKIKAKIRRHILKNNIKVVFIDYLGMIPAEGKSFSKHDEITKTINGLKAIAKEYNLIMVVLCQLNRSLEGRTNHRPNLSDLRESGSIEQTADIVAFVHREEYYLSKMKPTKQSEVLEWENEMRMVEGKSQLIISKARDDETGDIEFRFDGEFSRFTEI